MSTLTTIGSRLGLAAVTAPPGVDLETADPAVPMRLVRRLTFGYTPEELALARSLGPWGYIAYHMSPETIDDSAVENEIASDAYATLRLSPAELWDYYESRGYDSSDFFWQLTRAQLYRALYSNRQFYERVVDFWNDHFNTHFYADVVDVVKIVDDRDTIRAHAMTTFRDLLGASAKSPAMLLYLNNNTNIAEHPNENYARELLELHTLGVSGGYTQQDVMEVARCFTGWTLHNIGEGARSLTFRFAREYHDFNEKVIFAGTPNELYIPGGGGISDGEQVLDALASHPSTARFVSRKLLVRFWGENPPTWAIDYVAGQFEASGGDIRTVLWAVAALATLPMSSNRLKRPSHLLISALRALRVNVSSFEYIVYAIDGAGNLPYQWAPPNGYPDSNAYWSALQLQRWNIGAWLTNGELPGADPDFNALFGGLNRRDPIMERIDELLFGGSLSASDRSVLTNFLAPHPLIGVFPQRIKDTVSLAIASPSFQWY